MRKLSLVMVVVTALVIGLALVGGTLPEGSPLREVTQGMRDVGRAIADGFGGGYRPMTGG